ncbi:MAG: hypothetical protein ACPGVD_04000 [Flavobacteriales bacterium]
MRKNIVPGILLFSFNFAFSQIKSDTVVIKEILETQLKTVDRTFKSSFILGKTSMPYDTTKSIYKVDSIYYRVPFGKYLEWNQFKPISKFVELESDSSKKWGDRLFISTPVFNEDMTKCRFVVNFHFGEWGGYTRLCYYEKRRRKWKLTKQTRIISVN